jgi:hypothetical protein
MGLSNAERRYIARLKAAAKAGGDTAKIAALKAEQLRDAAEREQRLKEQIRALRKKLRNAEAVRS